MLSYSSEFLNRCFIWILLIFMLSTAEGTAQCPDGTWSNLIGTSLGNPTSLQFGPDDRLYVSEQAGRILIYTIERTGDNQYTVTNTETINKISQIQNHNDNGTVHNGLPKRQVTGLLVVGTASNPVIYVTSSDYRIGAGDGTSPNFDSNLDTNSGIISKLTWNGSSWDKIDLVRGLPRSEENHATNGLIMDSINNQLLVAQGGLTNAGAPSRNFAFITEFALSGAILSVDLGMLDAMTVKTDTSSGAAYIYDFPTLDDPERDNANGINHPDSAGYDGIDLHDPFGGNDGLNQAKIDPNGPVQIYATGFRNIYDLLVTEAGYLYTWDNGANQGWGGHPANEGVGTATNDWVPGEPGSTGPGPNDPQVNNVDGLHLISGPGYYAGHPNPVRGNPDSCGLFTNPIPSSTDGNDGVFRTEYLWNHPDSSLPYDWPPVPPGFANPIEGDYISPPCQFMICNPPVDPNNGAIGAWETSTNGLAEYTASNFNNQIKGDLLAVGFGSQYLSLKFNASGGVDYFLLDVSICNGAGSGALDIVTMGDDDIFPGTVWIADYIGNRIRVLEPNDFYICQGNYDNTIDEDQDGYTNADELDNGTDPCSGSSFPEDFDDTLINGFKVSNLNDPDDDDDGINDTLDVFFWDPDNGMTTTLPIDYPLLNGNPSFGYKGLGFTGLMLNLEDDYLDHFEEDSVDIIAGGASGVLTMADVDPGDCTEDLNTQKNALLFGLQVDSLDNPFVYSAQVIGPVFPESIQDSMSMGIFIGTGDQDNYFKLVINANGGTPGMLVSKESGGVLQETQYESPEIPATIGSEFVVTLYFVVNPANGAVRAQYALGTNDPVDLGGFMYADGPFLQQLKGPGAIALGVISTARGATDPFLASWEQVNVSENVKTGGEWVTLNSGTSCQPNNSAGQCCSAKHEASYVQVGDKFYWLGGRENNSNVNIYDVSTDSWTIGASPPTPFLHHFQAINYHGLILVAGAFIDNNFPTEMPAERMYLYDPITDTWHEGPLVPANRRRGSAGVVEYNNKVFMVSGIELGHAFGHQPWLDMYDPLTNSWTILPDAPRARDHFHAMIVGDTIYAAAGRRSNGNLDSDYWSPTEPKVDFFDISSMTWDSIAQPLPTERAGNTAAILENELLIIGGEVTGANPARTETEAMNLQTGEWRTLDNLNIGRHGTQAIVNNGGVYVASGSTQTGGSPLTRTTEAFYMYGRTTPELTTVTPSTLQGTLSGVQMQYSNADTTTLQVKLYTSGGNQASILKSMTTALGDTSVILPDETEFPRILIPGDTMVFEVQVYRAIPGTFTDTLVIEHTGASAPLLKIPLGTIEVFFEWEGGSRIYVDQTATGAYRGDSWTDALPGISTAFGVLKNNPLIREMWIASGVYALDPLNGRNETLILTDSLHVIGGFEGNESLASQRNPELYPVTITGDIGIPGDPSDNVYHIIVVPDTAKGTIIEDVTIEYGFADGTPPDDKGAGLLVSGELSLHGATVRFCQSVGLGAALAILGPDAVVRLKDCTFQDNSTVTNAIIFNAEGAELIIQSSGEVQLK